MMTVLLIA